MDSEEDEYHYSDDEDEMEYQYSEAEDREPGTGSSGTIKRSRPNDPNPLTDGKHKKKDDQNGEYRIIRMEELLEEQTALIVELAGVLDLDLPTAGILLRHFQWNKEKLFETNGEIIASIKERNH